MDKNQTGNSAWPVGRYLKYAVGEIILVVIGIVIALQINNWNENRKNRIMERALLENLEKEFSNNMGILESYQEWQHTILDNLNNTLSLTGPEYSEVHPDSTMENLVVLFSLNSYEPEVTILNAALSSNDISLLRNKEIRQALSGWQQELQNLYNEEELFRDIFNLQFIPLVVQFFPLKNIHNHSSRHSMELQALYRNREFESYVYRMWIMIGRGITASEDIGDINRELLVRVRDELELL